LELAIEELGKPPCKFAFMVMGSEGRMEQTLSTDQDNAIVFENVKAKKLDEAREYFLKLGRQVSQHLNEVGYKFCDGEIMASNPRWSQSLSVWKKYFSDWINSSDPQSILDASIFFDFRCVYGKKGFVNKLRQHVNKTLDGKSVFFYHLAQSVVKFKPPLSFTGKIISKNHSGDHLNLDIKKIIFPIVGFIRLYALYNKLDETNTLERLRQLHLRDVITKSMYDELVLSYNYLMYLRFRFQAKSILENLPPDNMIDINKLTQIEVTTLKKIFGEMNDLQTKLNFDFKGSM
jgi:CBS domain-containing protein